MSRGIGFTGLLAIAFIVLKLAGALQWTWAWVLAPFWIPLAAALVCISIALLFSRKRGG